jgi:hypothetical protein
MRFVLVILAAWPVCALHAQRIVVDASKAINSFSPPRAFGGAIDRLRGGTTKEDNEKNTERLLTDPVLKEMLGAGWGTVTYRQNTELMIEAWHWNPRGTWSNAAKQEGYFTGSQYLSNGAKAPSFSEFGFMAEKIFKKFSMFINFENFTDTRQSNYKNVVNGSHLNPTFDEIWTHTEGFVVNGGIKIRL